MKEKKIFERNFLSGASILLILNLLASAMNYVYQILIAGVLGVEAFGTINTIFSVMLVVAVPGTTITMLAARYLAICIEKKSYGACRSYVRKLTMQVTVLGGVILLAGIVLHNILGVFLKIDDTVILFMLAVICALGYYHPLYSGCMSGLKRFLPLGIYGLFIPVYKFIGLGLATQFHMEYQRLLVCLFAIIPGSIFTAVLGFWYVKRNLSGGEKESVTEIPEKDQWLDSLIVNVCVVLYMNIDILAVRHIGGVKLSGIYSAVTLFGRIIYYGATSLGTVLLPMVATKSPKEAFKMLRKILLFVGSVSILGLTVLNMIKTPLISFIYGTAYLEAADYLIYVSMISLSTGLLTIMINFFVGVSYVSVPRNALLALAVVILAAVFLSESVTVTLMTIGISGLICVIYLFIQYRFKIQKQREK